MKTIRESVVDKFLRYIQIPSPSDENSGTTPTTQCQFDVANVLVQEMKAMGIQDAHVDENCYVYGTIPATAGMEDLIALGFIAHMDTVSDFVDHKVNPVIHENYNGEDLPLGESGRTLSIEKFPHLKAYKGRTLITSDGTTILGADDKAGIAEIMTMAEILMSQGDAFPHGKVCIGFTPDEEVGAGADKFDIEKFGADFAFTSDGGVEGGIDYENFNAASAKVCIHGVNVHPGEAKDIMVNAALVAMEYDRMLPAGETPSDTEGYEGFYHLTSMTGNVEKAELSYIIRDHSAESFKKRQQLMKEAADAINKKYGEGTAEIEIKEQYRNMIEKILPYMDLLEGAKEAAKKVGITPTVSPIRGGTDGAQLSFRGLPCPNLGTGGYGYHGPYEHITVEGMVSSVEMLLKMVEDLCTIRS